MSDPRAIRKIALVTGASSGIGQAIALRLLKDGLAVIAVARNVDKMTGLRDLGAHTVALDVTDEHSIHQAVAHLTALYGGVDILINNAGLTRFGAIEEVTSDGARDLFEVNLFGVANMTKAVLGGMRERRAGLIVNISSMSGVTYLPLGAWYHATKHALEGWSDCLRLEVAPFGISVVIVEPGVIQTGASRQISEALLASSTKGPYAEIARKMARMLGSADTDGGGSQPSLIADLVSRAIRARQPRTRYVAGKHAKQLMWIRRNLGDRFFDRIVTRYVHSWSSA